MEHRPYFYFLEKPTFSYKMSHVFIQKIAVDRKLSTVDFQKKGPLQANSDPKKSE